MNIRVQIPPFDAKQRVKLAKLLGMLGSNADGEVLNAARLANRLVREAGLQWLDVVALGVPASANAPTSPKAPKTPRQARSPKTPKPKTMTDLCEVILRSPLASPWERAFATDLLTNWTDAELSRRQIERLRQIWEKLRPAKRTRKARTRRAA